MKAILYKPIVLSLIFIFTAVICFAQNAADSDLSNEADTNKNWSGMGWLIGVVIILVLVVFFTLRNRRRGAGFRNKDNVFKDRT